MRTNEPLENRPGGMDSTDRHPALTARDISISFGDVPVFRGLNLSISKGSFCSIIGPTGAGKSTLLSIFGGLQFPDSGSVLAFGETVTGPRPEEIGFVFQDASLLPWLTAEDNVAFPLELRGVDRSKRREIAREFLDRVGLSGAYSKRPAQLSGGMRQRVSIARCLVLDPPILLMDEPFGALDEQTREIMGDNLLELWEGSERTVILVTHSINEAIYLSDTVHVLGHRGMGIETIGVSLKRPRVPEDRGSEEFGRLRNDLRRMLDRSFGRVEGLQ